MGSSKNVKMWHYRLMVLMLYNEEMPGLLRTGSAVEMDIKELARYLGQRIYRLRDCLGNLEQLGICLLYTSPSPRD